VVGVKSLSAGDDVGGQLRQRAPLGECPRAQSAERLSDPDTELY
jgi:hypothetical protein